VPAEMWPPIPEEVRIVQRAMGEVKAQRYRFSKNKAPTGEARA
jgi:hypothetical protein